MTPRYEIRELTYADLPGVIALERRAFPTPWSLAMFTLELAKPSNVSLAAHGEDGELLGYVICSRYADVWHLMNVAVDPPRRRGGVASNLLESLFDRIGSAQRYTLEVRRSNLEAVALYRRYGFSYAGVRPRYYRDNGEDAVIMWRLPASEAKHHSTARKRGSKVHERA